MRKVYANVTGRRSFATKLANALNLETLNSARPPTPRDTGLLEMDVINWGSSEPLNPRGYDIEWIGNTPEAVKVMSNKRNMFSAFTAHNLPCLEWTTDVAVAQAWLDDNAIVYERHKLTGHSGQGIVIKRPGPDAVACDTAAPLFTKDLGGKFREYRVHIVDSSVICVQIKRRMSTEKLVENGFQELPEAERRIVRTYRNGWVFCVNNFEWPEEGQVQSLAALRACGASSGAVDIAVRTNGDTFVIETNSAPALRSDTVLRAYVDAFNGIDLETGEV
jgi:hypothetical protein